MILTGKRKRFLRALAVNEKAIFQIGKDGLNENLYRSLNEALKAREMVKISILKTCELETNEVVIELCAHTGASLVQTIGKTIVLYKPARPRKIILP